MSSKRHILIGAFFSMVLCLFLFSAIITFHYLSFDRKSLNDSLSSIVGVTHISDLSWGGSYLEPRVSTRYNSDNIAYPEMLPLDKKDFVYAKN